MSHVVLLGDSIFDNAIYVPAGTVVADHLRNRLGVGWRVTLAAVDGSVIADVAGQRVPADASHLVVSIGGNDALRQAAILDLPVGSVGDGLLLLGQLQERFGEAYGAMLDGILRHRVPTAVCTIYDTRLGDPRRLRQVVTGLSAFNDAITRQAFARGIDVIDLRLIVDRDGDYVNQIEPSAAGGAKIAAALGQWLSAPAGTGSRIVTGVPGRP